MTTDEATIEFLKTKLKNIVSLIAIHDISENHWVSNGVNLAPVDRYTHLRDEILLITRETLGEKTTNEYLFGINLSPEEIKNAGTS